MSKKYFLWLSFCFCSFVVSPVLADEQVAGADARPHWIWLSKNRSAADSGRFTKSFSVEQEVVSATLRCVGESAGLSVMLDDDVIATLEPYDPLLTMDVTAKVLNGKHALSIVVNRVAGPSAFFLQLDIQENNGLKKSIVSDTSWTTAGGKSAVSFGRVDSRLLIPKERRVGITAVDDYEQWKQALTTEVGTDPASFAVTPGFEIQRVRSARPDEDSWVSMEFDPQGRLLIAKESRGLLRMTLSDNGTVVSDTELIDDTMEECRGLVFFQGDLFCNANNSKGMYRLKKLDDDRFATPELIHASPGGVGHGRNDLALGPDAMIYSIHGDAVDIPQDAIDRTSPFRDARRGKKTSEGHLLRIDPGNGEVEVLAAGLRNPFGIDFNRQGDIFTYDADAEHDMGSPWYRPTRVSHLLTGGDYGWRGVTGAWPSYYPDHADNARPNLDIGKGSPTAVKFASGSNFPMPYREALFILDWAYGRIIAVHCLPRGSSYLMTGETFLQGRPLNVTDLDFSSDGSMYLVTGGRKTQSAIYRIRYVGDDAKHADDLTPQQHARMAFATDSRELRRRLESALDNESTPVEWTWEQLNNPDPWISQAAIHLLERYPLAKWQDRALTEERFEPALKALLSLARSSQQELFPAIIARLNQLPMDGSSRSQKLIALQAYSLCLSPDGSAKQSEMDSLSATRDKLLAMYPDDSYLVNRSLSELLVRIDAPDVVAKTVRLMNATTDQVEQMHYLYVLRGVRDGWTMADRNSYFTCLSQSKHYQGGAGMNDFIGKIREEAIATLSPSEIQSLGAIVHEQVDDEAAQEIPPRPFVKKWTVDEVLDTASPDAPRDLQQGKEMFAAAACIQCHRIAGRGTLVGPDLTSAHRRFSSRDLLTSIIEPSKVIAENYRSVQIVTSDGKTFVGQTALGGDYRSPQLHLATDPSNPLRTIAIEKSSILMQKTSDLSWMPAGLLDTLSQDQILDLIAYIESADSGAQ